MKDEQLKETLINISNDIYDAFGDSAHNINYGGCVYFAWLISKELESRNIDFMFSIFGDEKYPESNYNNIALNLGNDNDYPVSSYHGLIKIDNAYYDSDGVTKDPTINYNYGENVGNFRWISKQISNFYKNVSWNRTFKEFFDSKDLTKLKRIIKDNFKKYDTKIKNSVRYR